jgi:L-threonylcarbamoyladenylate synthase
VIVAGTKEHIADAAERLARGELVAIPTETVYGLAAHAFDEAAVARVFAAKERPTFDPLIVHVPPSWGALDALAEHDIVDVAPLDARARARAAALMALWPGPLTLVLPKHARVPDLVTAGLMTVAVRVPRHPVAVALLERLDRPLAAPSANRFGRISPTAAADVDAELGERVGLILDGGRCPVGVESTVIAVGAGGALTLLRPGGTSVEDVARVSGVAPVAAAGGDAPAAPGMLPSHYAPRKPLVLLAGPLDEDAARAVVMERGVSRLGVLAQAGDAAAWRERIERVSGARVVVEVLSAKGDMAEAARNLFAALRALDASDAELLLAEPCREARGLGFAIQDRLTRAAAG